MKKIRLTKPNFQPVTLRQTDKGEWESLAYTFRDGTERWAEWDKTFVEDFLKELPKDVKVEELN